jgi:hypothetical protein
MPEPCMGFASKAALERAIRAELDPHPIGERFESRLVADLIARRHYACSRLGLRPLAFRKDANPPPRAGYRFMGLFPDIGWHDVSWRKSVTATTWQQEVTAALRRHIEPWVVAYRQRHPECERCGRVDGLEVDHVDPEFADIARAAIALHPDAEWDAILAQYSWLHTEEFLLPAHLACSRYVWEAHKTCVLMTVCQPCHRRNAVERRASQCASPA